MKILLCLLTSFVAMAYTNAPATEHTDAAAAALSALRFKQSLAIGCAPDISAFDVEDPDNTVPLLEGWGKYRMPVTQANDSAYIYFQQGINMYYGFHVIEAMASFEKSIRFDENFAMGYWGKALAYGPNINDEAIPPRPRRWWPPTRPRLWLPTPRPRKRHSSMPCWCATAPTPPKPANT